MSRLIVKNLPKKVTENKIKDFFSQKGTVTDVQLKYTEDGKFRRFAFIGYKTEEEAAEALKFFNNTCLDTSKISVDYCAELGDASKPKSWSKYAADSNKSTKKIDKNASDNVNKKIKSEKTETGKKGLKKEKNKDVESNEVKELLEKHKDDPLFQEFLETHSKSNKNIWANDVNVNKEEDLDSESENNNDSTDDSDASENETPEEKKEIAKKNISDKEYMEALKKGSELKDKTIPEVKKNCGDKTFFTVKIRGLAYHHKKKDIKQFFKGIPAKSIRVPTKIKGIAYVGFKTEKLMKLALNKNKSFLEGKRIFVAKYEDKQTENNKTPAKESNLRWKQQENALKNEETIGESGKIFLRNLAYTATEDDIKKLFEKYGPLSEVNLPIDSATRKPKGFGTVTFLMPEHAVQAYSELDGSIQNGRMLHLLPAKTKITPEDLLAQDGLSYKQKKDLQQKVTAGLSHNWNTLFLGQNAVADVIAKSYNTTKENLLQDGGGTSAAVRLALGETQLVQETQQFLEKSGVKLTAFNQVPSKRSSTIILVKNLPAGTEMETIKELFAKHGELGRVILPPSGITAIVEFMEPYEARKAFNRLAYSKFKAMPLYLEWAPDDTLSEASSKSCKNQKEVDTSKKSLENKTEISNGQIEVALVQDEKKCTESEEDEDIEDEPEPNTILFVKNLNFITTEEDLKKHFEKCGRIHYATISTKKDPNNPTNKLSMGYGFVRYMYKLDAERALKELQYTSLDGKSLELKRSERTLQTDIKPTKKSAKITEQTGTKILVRNVPFQANADEVKDLFKPFGELKGVRLPKKMVGEDQHRGFAFIEFYTKKEAKRAFKALCQSTHLYGRRLVLEWAQTAENVEDLRKRTAKHFHEDQGAKKSKKANLNPESIGLE